MNITNLIAGLRIHNGYTSHAYAEHSAILAGTEECTADEIQMLISLGWIWDSTLKRWCAYV